MIVWAIRLAWMVLAALPLLPLLGRWVDPLLPPTEPHASNGLFSGLSAMAEVLTAVTQRLWMFPTIIGLCVTVVLLTGGAFTTLSLQDASWAHRRSSLWPLLALPFIVILTTLLDNHLPEFGR